MGLTQSFLGCFILPSVIEDESLDFVFHVSSTEICATVPFVVLIFLSGFGIDPLSQMLNINLLKFSFSNWAGSVVLHIPILFLH